MAHKEKQLVGLPLLAARPVDIGRLLRELELIDGVASRAKLADEDNLKLPKTSQLMDKVIELNQLDMTKSTDRELLLDLLKLSKKAPVLHISFNSDPSPVFIEKLMDWLRREIHPLILITIGLQPSIGAGCIVRSTNKYFDFSLRKDLIGKSELLLSKIRAEVVKV